MSLSPKTIEIADPKITGSAPSSLQFSRYREVPIPWLDLIAKVGGTPEGGSERVEPSQFFDRLVTTWANSEKQRLLKYTAEPWQYCEEASFWTNRSQDSKTGLQFKMKVGRLERLYAALDADGNPLTLADVKPSDVGEKSEGHGRYVKQLEVLRELVKGCAGWQLVATSQADFAGVIPEYEILELHVRNILLGYERANEQLTMADTLLEKTKTFGGDPYDMAEVDRWRKKRLELASDRALANASMLRMAELAARKGHVLALSDISVKVPGSDTPETYPKGTLYLPYRKTIYWEVTETKTRYRLEMGMSSSSLVPESYPVKVTKSDVVDAYQKLTLAHDPLVAARSELTQRGYTVFCASETDAGWTLSDGTLLSVLVARCERDEEFRRKCAVILLFQRGEDGAVASDERALVVKHPLPGWKKLAFPRIHLREELSYTVQWIGTELGALVSSINLAPGEERTINVSRTLTEEISSSTTRRSGIEEVAASSVDFSSELEAAFSNEFSKQDSSSTSVGLSASYGGIGGSFGQTNSSTTNIKSASQELNKIARKTAQSFNRKYQVAVSSTTTTKTAHQESSSYSAAVRNPNTGCTLNLLLYQVNNLFRSGVILNDLKISISDTVEMIENTGIFGKRTMRLHEVERVIPCLLPERLPLHLSSEVLADIDGRYWRFLAKQVYAVLSEEYADPKPWKEASAPIVSGTPQLPEPEPAAPSDRMAWALRKNLQGLVLSRDPLVQEILSVASGAFYLDGQIGVGALLDPYASRMRDLELDRVAANVAQHRIRNAIVGGKDTDWIVFVVVAGGRLRFRLRSTNVDAAKLRVFVGGTDYGIPTMAEGEFVVSVPQELDGDDLWQRVHVLNTQTGAVLAAWPR